MRTHTVSFVSKSEVFEGCEKAHECFCQVADDFCWGTNDHTLITRAHATVYAEDAVGASEDDAVDEQLKIVLARLSELPPDSFIDLES